MLKFLSTSEHYSTYLDTELDEEVCIAHGPGMRRLVEFDIDTMRELWRSTYWGHRGTGQEKFLTHLRSVFLTGYYDEIDEVRWCGSCEDVDVADNGGTVANGTWVCEHCMSEHYTCCYRCEEMYSDTNYIDGDSYCESCTDNHFTWCDDCDRYYHDDDGHNHDGTGCCETMAEEFTVRNDGDPALANDTRTTITLPAGTVDDEGIARIVAYLQQRGMWSEANVANTLDPRWQTKEGNFTKRFSRTCWKQHAVKITPEVLSHVGVIAREHSSTAEFHVELTRHLNQSAEAFYHEESCWWQSYYASRCALKSNGGFAMRTFGPQTDYYPGSVQGRAFVMPLKAVTTWNSTETLVPTFDTTGAAAYVVFNGYGNLQGYNATRILSHMTGMTYRKINFRCSPMYVNGDMGYLVAPEEIAEKYTDGSLYLDTDPHANLLYTEQAAALTTDTPELIHV